MRELSRHARPLRPEQGLQGCLSPVLLRVVARVAEVRAALFRPMTFRERAGMEGDDRVGEGGGRMRRAGCMLHCAPDGMEVKTGSDKGLAWRLIRSVI